MDDFEDIKVLLERIERNIKNSLLSDADKKYIGELIDFAKEKLSRIQDGQAKSDS